MVALLIRASTSLFGGSELGVRALSLLIVGAMPALIAFIAWRLFGSAEKAALAALMWIAMPLVAIGAAFVTPDAPLVVFWTLGLAALVELWRTGEKRWLIALGLALGLALQSKFTAAFFAAGVGLALVATPSLRRWLVSPALFAGLAVALVIFAPFVVWNAEHGWATFAKQLGRAPPNGFEPYYLAEFLVAQIGLLNPLVVAALVPAVAAIPWRAPIWRARATKPGAFSPARLRPRRSISFCIRSTTACKETGSRRFIPPRRFWPQTGSPRRAAAAVQTSPPRSRKRLYGPRRLGSSSRRWPSPRP